MESATKHAKSSSNISDIVSRFSKVCRLRSIGVFSSENPNHHIAPSTEGSSDSTEETECDAEKIHPRPMDENLFKYHEVVASNAIPKLFDTISALKVAYIQLQEAHIPYNPEKIQAADEHVVSQLKSLCEIKRVFKHKQITKPKSDCSLFTEIQDFEILLEKLQSQIRGKDSETLELQRQLRELDRENAELEEKLKQKALEERNVRRCKDLKPNSFYDTFKAASTSIHDFAKPLISLMKASCWDLDFAANSIEASIIYSKRSHKKFAFEAYISRRMFHGFSILPHNGDEEVMTFKDPFESLVENPSSDFANFCRSKYLLVVHPKMELSFFGNLDQRMFVSSGKHPRTPFYHAFVKMAKWIWVLEAMAALIEPKAEIFTVRKGSEFSDLYMENVVEDDSSVLDGDQTRLRIGFMVFPGFRHGENVIRSRVYLSQVTPHMAHLRTSG